MAVEDDARAGLEQPQEGNAGAKLVDEEGGRRELLELVREEGDLHYQVHLPQDGAEDGEAAANRGRHYGVAAHAHVEGSFCVGLGCHASSIGERVLTIAGLVEAVLRVAVRCEDGDFVPATLEADSGIDDQTLGPADAQVRVEEHNVLLCRCRLARHHVLNRLLRVAMHVSSMHRQVGCSDYAVFVLDPRPLRRVKDDIQGRA
jgi:hypothetical protein